MLIVCIGILGDATDTTLWSPIHTYGQAQTFTVMLTGYYQGTGKGHHRNNYHYTVLFNANVGSGHNGMPMPIARQKKTW